MNLNLARIFSLVFLAGVVWALWRVFRFYLSEPTGKITAQGGIPTPVKPRSPSGEVSQDTLPRIPTGGETTTGRFTSGQPPVHGLTRLRWLLVGCCLIVLLTHGYWAFFVSGPLREDESYMRSKRFYDQRNRRMEEIGLRGWVFDRRKKESEAGNSKGASTTKTRLSPLDDGSVLAGYRMKSDSIVRHYPLGADAAHLVGYDTIIRGSAGVELAYEGLLRPKPGKLKGLWTPSLMGEDLTLTIDSRLQRSASAQLAQTGQAGAIVVISVRTGDVLALASSPTFDPLAVEDDKRWQELSGSTSQQLVNRTLRRYYLPGSTFKTIIAASALENGLAEATFRCSREGYRPGGTTRPIYDDGGTNEVHGTIGLTEALRVSCNQYFAQLGVALGSGRLAETAKKFGFQVDVVPDASREPRYDDDVWDNKEKNFRRLFSPSLSRLVLSGKMGAYDLALESYGQGYLQVTPLQMALVAQVIAHTDGHMMAPRLDFLSEPRVLHESLSAQSARRLRAMMAQVTAHPQGTASAAFAQLLRAGISVGGKTGTAQFETTQGRRVDSWFIGFAPLDDPQIAFAVVVEGGGYGGRVAAPISAALVTDALRFGLIRRGKP